MNNEHILSNKV